MISLETLRRVKSKLDALAYTPKVHVCMRGLENTYIYIHKRYTVRSRETSYIYIYIAYTYMHAYRP